MLKERLFDFVMDEFRDFQDFMGIEDGGLDPVLCLELEETIEELADTMNKCMLWQQKNNK